MPGWEATPDDVGPDPRAPDWRAAGHVRPPVVRAETAPGSGHGLIYHSFTFRVTTLPASPANFANHYRAGRTLLGALVTVAFRSALRLHRQHATLDSPPASTLPRDRSGALPSGNRITPAAHDCRRFLSPPPRPRHDQTAPSRPPRNRRIGKGSLSPRLNQPDRPQHRQPQPATSTTPARNVDHISPQHRPTTSTHDIDHISPQRGGSGGLGPPG